MEPPSREKAEEYQAEACSDIAERESWPPTVEWLVQHAVAMKGAFAQRIAELEF